ncbi:MAG TPA: HEAT repeat domain-containing protein [Planctomycetota bacterium]|nr:HEAT repeat domain-containing protein [Planctomycetota bacterium]
MRTVGILLWVAALARADDLPQIEWASSWEKAFQQAKTEGKPVFVCINSKDGEQANEATAKEIYRDPLFVALSRRFVMVLVSTREHAKTGPCPRFGKVTCAEHLRCWEDLNAACGDTFVVPGSGGDMISPQHAWFAPDGRLLRRKEYLLGKEELMRRMRAALTETGSGGAAAGKAGPLGDKERADLERLKGATDREARMAALGNLLATEKAAVHEELLALLGATKDASLKGDILRALANAQVAAARPAAERLLADDDALVRSVAAVSLELLADKEALPALLKRARTEDDTIARKNVYRALGACGGPAADKAAAKALLDAVGGDKQKVVCKHAALALRGFAGAGAPIVRKKLEQAAARAKDPDVRRAIVYALAFVGDAKTTVPVMEKVLADEHEEWAEKFVRAAIGRINGVAGGGEGDPFEAGWLFWDDRQDPARGG